MQQVVSILMHLAWTWQTNIFQKIFMNKKARQIDENFIHFDQNVKGKMYIQYLPTQTDWELVN